MSYPTRAIAAITCSAVAVTLLAATTAALATPGSGVVSAPIVARGGFVDAVDLKLKIRTASGQDVVAVKRAADTVMQHVTLDPGGHSGWHSHHGPVVVVVQSGTITLTGAHRNGCQSRTYSAGQTFIDPGQGHVHIARNTGGTRAELWATYFDVPAGVSPRIDAAAPAACG